MEGDNSGLPSCPIHLTGVAAQCWQQIGSQLAISGLINPVRLMVLESYCATYERLRDAQQKLADQGEMVTRSRLGRIQKSPYLGIIQDCEKELRALRDELGLASIAPRQIDPKPLKLSAKQSKFVVEYLVDLNATQAALRAGYSPRTAYSIGWENLRKPEIKEALARRRDELRASLGVTPEKVIEEYAKMAFADMETYVQWGPDGVRLVDSENLPVGASAAVLEVAETASDKGRSVRLKLHDKKGSLDSLAKTLGMFVDRKEVSARLSLGSWADLIEWANSDDGDTD